MTMQLPCGFVDQDTFVYGFGRWRSLKSIRPGFGDQRLLQHDGSFLRPRAVYREQGGFGQKVVELVTRHDTEHWLPLVVTGNQAVASQGQWVRAGQLRPGDSLTLYYVYHDGRRPPNMEVTIKQVRERMLWGDTVYSVEVDGGCSVVVAYYRGQGSAHAAGGYIVASRRAAEADTPVVVEEKIDE